MRRQLAEIDQMLNDIRPLVRDLKDPAYPDFAQSEHAQICLREAKGTVRILQWAKGEPGWHSPIFGAEVADDQAIGREYLRACSILQNERPVPNGMTTDEVVGIKRALSWLKGGTFVSPLEFV